MLKGWIPTTVLAATLLFGSVTAHAGDGIIIGGGRFADTTTKTQDPCSVNQKSYTGIIIGGLTGIIIGGYTGTGIIVTDFATKDGTVNCGIIVGG
jgi:hypothetical protein